MKNTENQSKKPQKEKGVINNILSLLCKKKPTKEEVIAVQKGSDVLTKDLLDNYRIYFKKYPTSTIRQRASIFNITKYRSEQLTKLIKSSR